MPEHRLNLNKHLEALRQYFTLFWLWICPLLLLQNLWAPWDLEENFAVSHRNHRICATIWDSLCLKTKIDLSNSCAFQTKTLFGKMSQLWAVCFSRIWWAFPSQMALCVLLKGRALTSHEAKAWWMTWSSQFTFGWWSELNCQNAWISDGQCPACSDLFLMEWVDLGVFAPSRFEKRNKAGLLQSLTPEFLLGQQNSVSWIGSLYYYLHLSSAYFPTSGSTPTSTHLLQGVVLPKTGASGAQGLCSSHC